MKKFIVLSLMIVSALSVDAQRKRTRTATSQGNVVVRLGMGINHYKSDPDLQALYRETDVTFNPSVGYMVVDNLELGINFGVSNYFAEDFYTQSPVLSKREMRGTDVLFGVYAQKYFPLNNWFALYTRGTLGLRTGSFETDDINGSTTTPFLSGSGIRNGVGGSVDFGFTFTPYNAFAIYADIAGLSVSNLKTDYDGANNTVNDTHVGFNVIGNNHTADMVSPLSFGVAWYFGRGLWKK
ncbi:MAG: hypothetical protein R2831_00605 [Chitinophagaceae bacterium]